MSFFKLPPLSVTVTPEALSLSISFSSFCQKFFFFREEEEVEVEREEKSAPGLAEAAKVALFSASCASPSSSSRFPIAQADHYLCDGFPSNWNESTKRREE